VSILCPFVLAGALFRKAEMDIVLEDPDSLPEIGEGWQQERRCCNLATASFSSDNDTNSDGFQQLQLE